VVQLDLEDFDVFARDVAAFPQSPLYVFGDAVADQLRSRSFRDAAGFALGLAGCEG
jgi:hypothetical protein